MKKLWRPSTPPAPAAQTIIVDIELPDHVADWLMRMSASYHQSIPEAIGEIIQEAHAHYMQNVASTQITLDGLDNPNARQLSDAFLPTIASPDGGTLHFPDARPDSRLPS
ncbi:MAG: hypothetical protein ACRENK_16550 [Gemmatimonadaceae bacterium]